MKTVVIWVIGLFICSGLGGLIGIQFSINRGGYVGMAVGAIIFAAMAIWLGGPYGSRPKSH
jgi:hypothetical protein